MEMKRKTKMTSGLALLLAVIMVCSTPASVLAASPKQTEIQEEVSTQTEPTSEVESTPQVEEATKEVEKETTAEDEPSGTEASETGKGSVQPEENPSSKEETAPIENEEPAEEVQPQENADNDIATQAVGTTYDKGGVQITQASLETVPQGTTTVKSNDTSGYEVKMFTGLGTGANPEGYTNLWLGYRFQVTVPAGYDKTALQFTSTSYDWLKDMNSETTQAQPVWDEGSRTWTLEGRYKYTGENGMGTGPTQEYGKSIALTNAWMIQGDTYTPSAKVWIVEDGANTGKSATGTTVTVQSKPTANLWLDDAKEFLSGFYSATTGKVYSSKSAAAADGGGDAVKGRFYAQAMTLEPLMNAWAGNEKIGAATVEIPLSVSTKDGLDTTSSMQPILVGALCGTDLTINRYSGSGAAADATFGGRYNRDNWNGLYHTSIDSVSYSGGTVTVKATPNTGADSNNNAISAFVLQYFVPVDEKTPEEIANPTNRVLKTGTAIFKDAKGASGQDFTEPSANLDDNTRTAKVGSIGDGDGEFVGAYSRDIQNWGDNIIPVGVKQSVSYAVSNVSTNVNADISAYDAVLKFDGSVMEPTATNNGTPVEQDGIYTGTGSTRKVYYGVLPTGQNWTSDAQMNTTRKDGIIWYDTLAEAKTHGVVVATKEEARGGNQPYGTSRSYIYMQYTSDATKTGRVYQATLDVDIWNSGNVTATGNPNGTMYSDHYVKSTWEDGKLVGHDGAGMEGTSMMLSAYAGRYRSQVMNGNAKTDENANSGYWGTRRDSGATFDITAGERIATLREDVSLKFPGDPASETDTDITFKVLLDGAQGAAAGKMNYIADSVRLNADYVPGTNPGDAGMVQNGIAPDKIVEEDGYTYAYFTVKRSGEYQVYVQYALGDPVNLANDLPAGAYTLNMSAELTADSKQYATLTNDGLWNTIVVSRTTVAGFSKSSVNSIVAPGGDVEYLLRMSAQNRQISGIFGLDILPFNGDGRGTSMKGSYDVLDSALMVTPETAGAPVTTNLDLYYTTDTAIQALPLKKGSDLNGTTMADGVTALGCTWHKAVKTGSGETVTYKIPGGKATAITFAGMIGQNETPTIELKLKPTGNSAADTYANTASLYSPDLLDEFVSNTSPITVATRNVNGKAWSDGNGDGAQDNGEAGIQGLTVKLWDNNGTDDDSDDVEITADASGNTYNIVTGTDGSYSFDNAPSIGNKLYVTFEGGTIGDYATTTHKAATIAEEKNSDVEGVYDASNVLTKAVSDHVNLMTLLQQQQNKVDKATQQLDAGFVSKVILKYVSNDTNMGTVAPAEETILISGTAAGATATAKAGYHFVNWTNGGTEVSTDATFAPVKPAAGYVATTYTANFAPNEYTVKFDKGDTKPNGITTDIATLTGGTDQKILYKNKATAGTTVTINNEEYAFTGWSYDYTAADGTRQTGTVMDYTTVEILGDVTFTATYAHKPFVVANAQGGYVKAAAAEEAVGTDTQSKYEIPDTVTLPTTAVVTYAPQDKFALKSIIVTDLYGHSTTLDLTKSSAQDVTHGTGAGTTAKVTLDLAGKKLEISGISSSLFVEVKFVRQYDVSFYEENGMTQIGITQKVFSGETAKTEMAPHKEGYKFSGWTSDNGATKLTKEQIEAKPVNEDTMYKATYTANTYEVVFDKNADAATGAMNNQSMTYDTETTLTANSFANSGYIFQGWATEKTGTVVYTDQANVKNLVKDGTVTLYAVWGKYPPVTENPEATKILEGDTPTEDSDFTIRLSGKGNVPMPEGSTNGTKDIVIAGAGKASFGEIAFTEEGTYVYEIRELDDEIAGYTYSEEVYTMTVKVTDNGTSYNKETSLVKKNGDKAEAIRFTNKYTKPVVESDNQDDDKRTTPGSKTDKAIKTGDTTAIGAIFLILLLSAGAIVLSVKKKKRD